MDFTQRWLRRSKRGTFPKPHSLGRSTGLPVIGHHPHALDRYVALTPDVQSDALTGLATRCVERFDTFRAPLTMAERERRVAASLTPRQIALLERWGYPYAFDQFHFHMTLAGQGTATTRRVRGLAQGVRAADGHRVRGRYALAGAPNDPSSRFRVVACRPLSGTQ